MKIKYFSLIIVLIGLIIVSIDAVYTVSTQEVVIITQFGEIVGSTKFPGLHIKIPFIQEEHVYPFHMIYKWNEKTFNVKTLDKNDIQVSPSVQWMVNDAIKFHKEVRYVENAAHRMEDILYSALINFFSSKTLSEIEKNYKNKTEDGILLSQEINDVIIAQCKSGFSKSGLKIYKIEIQMKLTSLSNKKGEKWKY